jgi:4-oxalocrotonate tautomerase
LGQFVKENEEEIMPIISMEGPVIKDLDKKRKLTRLVTEAAAEAYGLPLETIIVTLKENAPDNVSVGGQLIIDRA